MALTLGDNFSYGGSKPLDARLTYATLADMKAVADSTMYNGCLAYCVATDKTYQWKSSNTVDTDTGRWREFQTGSTIVVDDAISSSSENPVQNKVIKTALDGKVNTESGKGLSTNDYDDTEKAKVGKAYLTDDTAFTAIADADYIPVYDTSDTAKKKSLWSNIKSVLKTYFDTLYSTVRSRGTPTSGGTALSLVNTGDMYTWNAKQNALTAGANISFDGDTINAPFPVVANQFDKSDLYSTTEKVVGCWTDGRPVYQKTLNIGALSDASTETEKLVSVGATVKKYIKAYLMVDGTSWQSAEYHDSTHEYYLSLYNNSESSSNKNKAGIIYKGNLAWVVDSYVIVQYTKTTDAANSFNYADENDYSTTEHIVGTWIDGKPVYQKLVDVTSQLKANYTNVTTKHLDIGISNIKRVCSAETIFSDSTSQGNQIDVETESFLLSLLWFHSQNKYAVNIKGDWSEITDIYLLLQYTKTTD